MVLIDGSEPAAGTSGACDSYVSVSTKVPGVALLAAESQRLWRELAKDLGDIGHAAAQTLAARGARMLWRGRVTGFERRGLDIAAVLIGRRVGAGEGGQMHPGMTVGRPAWTGWGWGTVMPMVSCGLPLQRCQAQKISLVALCFNQAFRPCVTRNIIPQP